MGSQHKQTRQLQKEQIAAHIEKRTALLNAQGKTAAQIAKDAQLKKLKGDLKRTAAAIASIDKRSQTVTDVHTKKTANVEKRSADRTRKKKDAAQKATPEAEKKKKKEKKPQ